GRKSADDFVKAQNAFTKALSSLIDPVWKAHDAGTLTKEFAEASQQTIGQLITDYQTRMNSFAMLDPKHTKVIDQAFASVEPLITNVRSSLNQIMASYSAKEETIKATGGIDFSPLQAAVTLFDSAVKGLANLFTRIHIA